MTLFGLFFVSICFIGWFKPVKYLFSVVIFSCVFQAAAVFNVGTSGIPPYIVADFFFITKVFLGGSFLKQNQPRFFKILLFFVVYSVILSFVMPFVFDGVGVIVPGETNDNDLAQGEILGRLSFSSKNMIQIAYLVINTLTICSISNIQHKITKDQIVSIFLTTIKTVLFIGFWEFIAKVSGTYYFPDSFFYSNEGYAQYWLQGLRLNATFAEPSYAGAFLASSSWALIYYGKLKKLLFFVLLALVLNMSGTAIMAFMITGVFCVLFSSKMRIPCLLGCFLLYLLAYLMSYDTLIGEMVLSKSDSISGLARMGAVTYTIGMITDTYFIGVGLGSHRCFSFLTNLMSAVGFIGFFLFFYFIWALVKPILDKDSKKYASIVIFGLVLFVAQCVAIPDFSFPIMWMWIYLSVILHFKYTYDCS